MSAPDPNVACEHGHQRRKCPHCEITDLTVRLKTAEQERDVAREAFRLLQQFGATVMRLSKNESGIVKGLELFNEARQDLLHEQQREHELGRGKLYDLEARLSAAQGVVEAVRRQWHSESGPDLNADIVDALLALPPTTPREGMI